MPNQRVLTDRMAQAAVQAPQAKVDGFLAWAESLTKAQLRASVRILAEVLARKELDRDILLALLSLAKALSAASD